MKNYVGIIVIPEYFQYLLEISWMYDLEVGELGFQVLGTDYRRKSLLDNEKTMYGVE